MTHLILLSALFTGAAPEPGGVEVSAAIARGVAFLEQDAALWKEEHNCASCHHLPLATWTLYEARRAGHAVNDALLGEWTAWLLTDPKARVIPDPEKEKKEKEKNQTGKKSPEEYSGVDMAAVYTSLALSAMPAWDDRMRSAWNRIAAHVVGKQTPDGSFAGATGRPPLFERPEATTALAALSLSPSRREAGLRDVSSERERALRWLATNPTGGAHQALVLRLLLSAKGDAPAAEKTALLAELEKRQGSDGGWSQAAGMQSDALATGQSLYALREAGVPRDAPAIRRGVAFLLGSQLPEGKWPMASRPTLDKPDGGPAKYLRPIICAGTAWATLGLIRAAPPRELRRARV